MGSEGWEREEIGGGRLRERKRGEIEGEGEGEGREKGGKGYRGCLFIIKYSKTNITTMDNF